MPPETHYAKKGETSIGYHVVGDGPVDLVLIWEVMLSNAEDWGEGKVFAL